MKTFARIAGCGLPALVMAGLCSAPGRAQSPTVVAPIVLDTAVPIIVNTIKPKSKTAGLGKFEGYVMHANIAQITVRAKGNDMSLQTFSLSEQVAAKMQTIVDKGGYQYGDKVTVYYDPTTKKALKIKGKPSKAT
ncbi:MAG TPA: hypothetical protein VNH65_02605 [Candidatus Acidoferrum sp.]|nr:hypothetical protein [Candidatus Acidoferrum sp.]